MSQIDNVAYGLAIFKAHGATVVMASQHVIWCVPVKDINEDDVNTLNSMGWEYNERGDYWSIFT